jgi:hypothetical protein
MLVSFKSWTCIMLAAGLICLSGQAEMSIVDDDFEHDTVSAVPFKAPALNPGSPGSSAAVEVVASGSNIAGTGNGLHFKDDVNFRGRI